MLKGLLYFCDQRLCINLSAPMKISYKLLQKTLATLVIFSSILFYYGCETMKELENPVQEAYALRMDGHADSAVVILEELIESEPNNATALYEMARTTMHIGFGNPDNVIAALETAQEYMDRALLQEARNPIFLYFKGNLEGLALYISLEMGQGGNPSALQKLETTYSKLYEVEPSCLSPSLGMLEIYAGLPVEMGGDSSKAAHYAEILKDDLIFHALATELLMTDGTRYIEFWKAMAEDYDSIPRFHESLGKAYLWVNRVEEAQQCFDKAIALDPSKQRKTLFVDVGRYYMMQAMQMAMPLDSVAPIIDEMFNKYLQTKPCKPLQAWAMGQLAMVKMRSGEQEEAKRLLAEAEVLDPYYSKAFSIPDQILYTSPDTFTCSVKYYFRPF